MSSRHSLKSKTKNRSASKSSNTAKNRSASKSSKGKTVDPHVKLEKLIKDNAKYIKGTTIPDLRIEYLTNDQAKVLLEALKDTIKKNRYLSDLIPETFFFFKRKYGKNEIDPRYYGKWENTSNKSYDIASLSEYDESSNQSYDEDNSY